MKFILKLIFTISITITLGNALGSMGGMFGGDEECTQTIQTLEKMVFNRNDDAEEKINNGDMNINSSDLELTEEDDRQIVGIRFQNLNIPQGATITKAYIQFEVDEPSSEDTSLTIKGEDTDNSSAFSDTNYDISSRNTTNGFMGFLGGSVSWSPPSWSSENDHGTDQRTPDLKNIVQEIVNRSGWSSGNAMSFIITGSGRRVAESYDGESNAAPLLHIEYMGCPKDEDDDANNGTATATCYALTDNSNKLYKVTMQPNGNPLPVATTVNISQSFNGEGSAYRASNNTFYAFTGTSDDVGPSNLYSINVNSGVITPLKTDIITGENGTVEGAEFYFDPILNREILYVISQEEDSKLYAFDPENNWSLLDGYPKNTHTDLSSLAIDPTTGIGYAVDDYNYGLHDNNDNHDEVRPYLYSINLKTGATNSILQLQNLVDAEGLAFASDGNLYIEDEGWDKMDFKGEKRLYKVDLQTGDLTPSAITNSSGDIEGLSCNGTQIAIDKASISIQSNPSIVEGDSGTREMIFNIVLNKPTPQDINFTYSFIDGNATDGNATLEEDYQEGSIPQGHIITIPKDSNATTISVLINGDTDVENDETFTLKLDNITNAIFSPESVSAVGTIINDDSLPNPIAEYRFDACSWNGIMGEVKDSSSNTNHLNAINNVQTTNGKILRALDVHGANQRVEGDTNITLSHELTLSVWIKTSTNQAVGGAYTRVVELSKTGGSRYSTDLAYLADGKTIRAWTTNDGNHRSSEVRYNLEDNGFHDGHWHFLTFTYDNGESKLYVDGDLKRTRTKDIGDIADPRKISIGGYYHSSGHRFTGQIDEVQLFDKALSAEEINILKQATGANRTAVDCSSVHTITGVTFQDENRNSLFDATTDVTLKNIKVQLFKDINSDGQYDQLDTLLETKESDINGKFAFTNITSGYYLLVLDNNDSDIPAHYSLSSNQVIPLHLMGDSDNNYFPFTKEPALPVGCLENALMFQNRPTDISYLDLSNGHMDVEAENVTPGNINGAGFNKKDGYYWGFNHTLKHGTLSRVGKDSSGHLMVDHFKIPNLTINSYTGDIDDNGHLYLKENRKTTVSVIDLDPSSDTYLTKLPDITLGQNLGIADWAFNPQDDKLYAVTTTYLYKIEPSDGKIISVQDINITGKGGFGASFFDKNGFYYIYRNGTGEIFRIDVDAEHPQAVPFATGGKVSSNDGAMCTDVEIRFDFGDLPSNYATTLEKDGARHRIKTSEGKQYYLGNDVTTENNGKPSVNANIDQEDDGVTVRGFSLQGFKIRTKLDLKRIDVKTHGAGYLNAWIDWNRDGDFNASEQIAKSVDGSSGSITLDLDISKIPDIFFNGEPIYARFRYSSQQDLNSTGVAPNGEVEDYRMETAHYTNIRIDDIAQIENDEGTTDFTFTVSIDKSGVLPMDMMQGMGFYFRVKNGTATLEDNDYTLNTKVSGSLFQMGGFVLISPLDSEFTITVPVKGDTKIEENENFFVELYSPAFINIRKNIGVGTIINDDSPKLSIERVNSNNVDNATEERQKSFYTQISGRDFDYSIVSYEGDTTPYKIEDITVKVELRDKKSTVTDEVIAGPFYFYIHNGTERFDVNDLIKSNDLKIQSATRDAEFKVSYLLDENGSIIHGKYDNAIDYIMTKRSHNNEKYGYSDNFAIRPAGFKVMLWADDGEYRDHLATSDQENGGALAAGYDYELHVSAIDYDERLSTPNYTLSALKDINHNLLPINQQEINATLLFDDNKTKCRDKSNKELKYYNFRNGNFVDHNFKHNNVGDYKIKIIDRLWTSVDQTSDPLDSDCIINSSMISNSPNEMSGCDIDSNFKLNNEQFYDMKVHFSPYSFGLNSFAVDHVPNTMHYLYMNDMDINQSIGMSIIGNVVAQAKGGETTTNFTDGCAINSEVDLTLTYKATSDRGDFNETQPLEIRTKKGTPVNISRLVTYDVSNNLYSNKNTLETNITIASKNFKDEDNGSTHIEMIYNLKKNFSEPINPLRLTFKKLKAIAKDASTSLADKDHIPTGEINLINSTKTLYYGAVLPNKELYDKTLKRTLKTPVAVYIYCKHTSNFCIDIIDDNALFTNKSRDGWFLANQHTNGDGIINPTVFHNANVQLIPNPINPFMNGRNSNISTSVNEQIFAGPSASTVKIQIDINPDPWLRYHPDASRNGNPFWTVPFKKDRGIISGLGEGTGHTTEIKTNIVDTKRLDW